MTNEHVLPEPVAVHRVIFDFVWADSTVYKKKFRGLGEQENSVRFGSIWETLSGHFIVDATVPKHESLQSVRSTRHDIRSR